MSATETLSADEQRLAELGYKQELSAAGAGSPTSRSRSRSSASWPDASRPTGRRSRRRPDRDLDRLAADLRADPASSHSRCPSSPRRMPTAGGIYYWASRLGGPGWGWFTGWFNLIGLVAVVASVVYVAATFLDDPARPLQRPLHLQLRRRPNVHYSAARRSSPCSRSSSIVARPDQRLLAATSCRCSTASQCGGT